MSDLLNFFGDNESEKSPNLCNGYSYDNGTRKSAKRPNTLKSNILNTYNDKNQQRLIFTPSSATDKRFAVSPEFVLPILTSLSCSNLMDLPNELPPENAKGNIEYKRQLLNLTPLRMQHLITQLKWRLEEGQGEAIYEIGVEDDGTVSGLEIEELNESISNLLYMANTLHASITFLRECNLGTKKAVEILIRNMPTQYSAHETKVAVLGNMDAGKSTLIGVLTQGMLDDGHGKTRLSTFRHIHEVRSGRTSSINCQLLGFDDCHNVTNFYWLKKRLHQRDHDEVALSSTRLVSLIDVAGCWKYQHTTLFALTSRRPHFVLLVVSAINGLKGTAMHHFQVSRALRLPVAVVVTKTDRCSASEAVEELRVWLSGQRYSMEVVLSAEMAQAAAARMSCPGNSSTIVPVFLASCVSGKGISEVTAFLGNLRERASDISELKDRLRSPLCAEVWIHQMHKEVPRVHGSCVVLVGHVHRGPISEHDRMLLGPQRDGSFVPVTVHSIHRNRLQHYTAHDSQSAAFAVYIATQDENRENLPGLKWCPQSPVVGEHDNEHMVQRGMVLLGQEPFESGHYVVKRCTKYCDHKCCGHVAWGVVVCDIELLGDENSLLSDLKRFPLSWILHCGNVYQKCQVVTSPYVMNNDLVKKLPSTRVAFRFSSFPQFVHCDEPIVFHLPHRKNTRAHGRVSLLIGQSAFADGALSGGGVHGDSSSSSATSLALEMVVDGRTECRHGDSDDDDDDDLIYVTAPSSPSLL